jgi:hypothetical protein
MLKFNEKQSHFKSCTVFINKMIYEEIIQQEKRVYII